MLRGPNRRTRGQQHMRATLTAAVVVLAAALAVGAAQAVRPGKNGAIYFESFNDQTQSTDIYAISPSGSGLREVTKTQDSDEADPSVSPNGRLVAFVSDTGGTGAYHLALMSSNGSGAHALAAGGVAAAAPTWSPNGRLIAFSRCLTLDPEGGNCTNAQIAVIGSNGRGVKLLTKRVAGAVDSRPSWSPNGKQLVFQRMVASGAVSVWTVNATGKSSRRIVNDASDVDHNPTWAPNGRTLVYNNDTGHEAIWQVDGKGHGKKRLFAETSDPDDETTGSGTENPSISPNGQLIVYTAGGDLWTAALDGKNRKQLTQNGGDEADWSRG